MALEEINSILEELMPFAQQTLTKYGEFYPFGCSMKRDGKISMLAIESSEARPLSQALIEELTLRLKMAADSRAIIASGICFDARYRPSKDEESTDAICCHVEDHLGEALAIYVPYKREKSGSLVLGSMSVNNRKPAIFLSGPNLH